jgi:integrase
MSPKASAETTRLDHRTFNDGRIYLYRREDYKKPIWFCRVKVPNTTGYVFKSTRTTDEHVAYKFADDLFHTLLFKVKSGGSIREKKINALLDLYEQSSEKETWTKHNKYRIENLRLYAANFFASRALSEIKQADFHDYLSWREKNGRKKQTISNTTKRLELSYLKNFLDWCVAAGHLPRSIQIKKPPISKNRRPHFDNASWRKVTRHLREYIKHDNPIVVRDRVMLVNYVLILANTGIRVGEARTLKWRDISDISPEKGSNEPANIAVYVRGKTGAREVVSRTPEVKKYFARILELRRNELGEIDPELDSYVFCHKDGTPIKSFKKSFNALLKSAGVEMDSGGQRRTIYSLRHTYATFRLHEGVNHFILARNMGTSVAMLESFYGHTSNIAAAKELTKNSGYNSSAKTRSLDWLSK